MDTISSSTVPTSLIARENEFTLLQCFLLQQNQQQLLVVGYPGTGRSYLVKNFTDNITNDWQVKWLDLNLLYTTDSEQFLATFKKELITNIQEKKLIVLDELESLQHSPLLLSTIIDSLEFVLHHPNLHLIIISDWHIYQKFLMNNTFLIRHLQLLKLSIPTPSQTYQMLISQKDVIEQLYQIRTETTALKLVIEIAEKYVPDCYLPKSAFNILHQAAAAIKHQHKDLLDKPAIVSSAQMYLSIDSGFIIQQFPEKLLQLSDKLHKHLAGQKESCELITQYLQSYFLNFAKAKIFAVILTGINHTGKTTLATILAKELFGSTTYFKKIDLASYQREDQIAELIKQLAMFRAASPCGVWLFDNMQLASLETIFVLQRIVETGQLASDVINSAPLKHTIFLFNMQISNEKWQDLYNQTARTSITTIASSSTAKNELLQLVLTDFPVSAPSTARPMSDELVTALTAYLANHFGQNFIASIFVIPFLPLTVKHKKSLLEHQIKQLSEKSSITITFDSELMIDLVAKINEKDVNGAQVSEIIYREILPILNKFVLQAKANNKEFNSLLISKTPQGIECQIVE